MREIVDAIVYQNRTGCQWAYLPRDLPPKSATYYYFALWVDAGFKDDVAIHSALLGIDVQKVKRSDTGAGLYGSPSSGWSGRPTAR